MSSILSVGSNKFIINKGLITSHTCVYCDKIIPYEKRYNKFCNRSCAALFNNSLRPIRKRKSSRYFCPCGNKVGHVNKYCKDCIESKKCFTKVDDFNLLKTSTSRRNRLIKILPHQCQICSTSRWDGQPVPLCMDHIDGNSDNNTRENLRLICLNCDGLLPTFKNRNKGNGRYSRKNLNK